MTAPTTPRADDWIDTVISRAVEMRAAGISTITIDGCSVTLTALESPIADLEAVVTEAEPDADPLNSPATYADGRVPGFERERTE